MENRSHALIAGVFVLLLGCAVALALWWLSQGGMVTKRYVIETRHSVTGLNVQGQVRYRGIRAGKVESLTTDPAEPARILVTIALDERFVVTRNSTARLGFQGLTGIAFVQIDDDGSSSEALTAPAGELPRIPMSSGEVQGLVERAASILEQVQRTTEKLNVLFNQRNLDNIASTLDHLAATSAGLSAMVAPENQQRWQRILTQLEAAAGQTAPLTSEVRQLVRTLGELAQRGDGLLQQTESTGNRLNAATLPQAEQLMRELGSTSRQLARVLEQLEREPQMLVLGARGSGAGSGAGPGEAGFVAPAPDANSETVR